MENQPLIVRKARVHNLKDVSLTLQPKQLIVFTGVSGSGKSSMAFDTIYVEGQRRYVESLSTFARRYMGDLAKPDAEHISGISPTISIEQKTAGRNPRSTVGTMTEIYDYLRVLYARVGVPHCPLSGERVTPQSRERIILTAQALPEGSKIIVLAPFAKQKKSAFKEDFQELLRKGFMRVRVDGEFYDLDTEIDLDGSIAHDLDIVIDRLVIRATERSRVAEAINLALDLGEGVCRVLEPDTGREQLFSMHAFSEASGESYESLEPQDFSFNSPSGMCERCQGLGIVKDFNLESIIDPEKSIAEDCCSVASSYGTVRFGNIYDNLAELYSFDVHTPWKKLPKAGQTAFLYGIKKKYVRMQFVHPTKGTSWTDYVQWRGVLHEAHKRYAEASSEVYTRKMDKLMSEQVCPECEGTRLKPFPNATLLAGRSIAELTRLPVIDCLAFFDALELPPTEAIIAEELLKEIRQRLRFLVDVGLDYLTLDRTSPTLSGGEAQRVRLASQIGCGLVGVTYVLDEPSIGLHPRDNQRLLGTLQQLRDKGNTVIVVEHDEETMWAADTIVDFGPLAGVRGGEIVAEGSVADVLKSPRSITGQYLRGEREIAIPKKRRKAKGGKITIRGATYHNLQKATASFPTGIFIAVTGVSGSGKSSLVSEILYPACANALHNAELPIGAHSKIEGIDTIDKVISIDQSPIGRNPRSNPATYIKVLDEIRELFTQLPE
ncbi:MAG: excinuclease ABC subunit UvrA, partial [Chlamydiia bacterium]|nr:excinuclease ABC subunit UvrA [Chlamydiia bacterium]